MRCHVARPHGCEQRGAAPLCTRSGLLRAPSYAAVVPALLQPCRNSGLPAEPHLDLLQPAILLLELLHLALRVPQRHPGCACALA